MKKRNVVLTTDAHRPAFDDFADALQNASQREGWRSAETLRNFLDAGFRAVRGNTLPCSAFDQNEAEYMKIVAACRRPQETMLDLSRMLGATRRALAADPVDFIGPVFSELSADAGMGQFFTPYHLSYLIAKMTISEKAEVLKDGKSVLWLSEPACGVGGMVLAANQVLREAGYCVAQQCHWQLIDIDFRAMAGAYLQVALTDGSADVFLGSALSCDPFRLASRTPAAVIFPKRRDEDPAMPPPAIVDGAAQLSLF